MIDCLRSYCLVKLRGFAHLVALGLVSMLLLCKIAKPVGLVDRIEMRKTDCFGKTRLHHELESVIIINFYSQHQFLFINT